jgi:hypothetical protein
MFQFSRLTLLLLFSVHISAFIDISSQISTGFTPKIYSICNKFGQSRFASCIRRRNERLKSSLLSLKSKNVDQGISLHTVDISPFLNCDDDSSIRLAAAKTLWNALTTHGCFYVTGHGIDEAESLEAARILFSQPESIKNEVRNQRAKKRATISLHFEAQSIFSNFFF